MCGGAGEAQVITVVQPPKVVASPVCPSIFLAGPIQGARDWQTDAIIEIQNSAKFGSDLCVFNPRRSGDFVKLDEAGYAGQVKWEHVHLRRAACDGVVMFWLAREEEHNCSRAYAQTTRFELGEAVALRYCSGMQIVVGIEEGFSGARYIRQTLAAKAPTIPVCSTLTDTCVAAVRSAGVL